jgi:hypothetical protein
MGAGQMQLSPAAAFEAIADAADALARLARECANLSDHPSALVPLRDAARLAATTIRILRDAVRAGELVAYGRERDRAVRRGDLDAWIESRRVPTAIGPADADIDRRMRRLAQARRRVA